MLELTAYELAEKVRDREVSAREAAEAALARIDEVEERVRSFITLTPELALERAGRVDERAGSGGIRLWEAVPIAVKDVLSTRGVQTTCGSKILEGFEPVYDASALRNFGGDMIMLGKANMDEFAMGSSTENSAYGVSRNPWDLERVPGGSSGGSAAAVAAGEGWWALGTDTGGSVRQPAALCGIVGLKPTYGRVSRYGLIAFASSLDQIGPMTRDVRDAALLLQAVAGHDPRDSTSAGVEVPDYLAELDRGAEGLRVGLVTELTNIEGVEPGVREVVESVARRLEGAGASVEEASLPHAEYGLPAYYIVAPAEVSSNLARYDGVRYGLRVPADGVHEMYRRTRNEGFGAEAKRRIMIGTYALSSGYYEAYYARAQKVRTRIIQDFRAAFSRFDVLLSPTSPTVAFRIGERVDDPLAMYASDICSIPANMAGLPAISVPGGLSEGLPVGVQLMSDHFTEPMLLRAARAVEEVVDFRYRMKP
ncbi:Asp-tRNA(Asn)/Glu-tRNA(Gln) amidotransferase subunit GatA [Rubrobacter taiwanensis]|jgi:aspartyl-tRNA(Asn)/glutamyl-tRNA(Gln) amidotransferase subunit A|uniref:Glutamyl-tRNA(Gln) amidotransferase subunit A n=1 Tax=Rubrobacter taiwanensis TaxID=185139 RepID=A0A4R1BLX4_9ACTN|nr:Asp-tRNA(Asn)/Glu-tRNA(Gln) amidotransferase subunit GatA [Rubrobacter taiwanensis]TCJ18346.1 Asp-tRNA(Asn)/Glu-tRNA(Gln) amidotransferase subunit GatA [Rubrobacter taiwanensis]